MYVIDGHTTWRMLGHGQFADYQRSFVFPHVLECHVGPIDPTADVQQLDNVMFQLQGQLPPGDPDFDLLRITAGNAFGMPSPGHTTLTRMPSSGAPGTAQMWNVDSFFDITYRIDFVGAPSGPFAGMSGSTTGTIRMVQGGPVPRYTIDGFGLPHTEVGQAKMKSVITGIEMFRIENIGSSGNDGAQVSLGWWGKCHNRCAPNLTPDDSAGVQGWTGAIDFGPSGNLPTGCAMRGKGVIIFTFSHANGGMDSEVVLSPSLTITEINGGQAALSINPCDSCPSCCKNVPALPVKVDLFHNGQVVASQTYLPPYPEAFVTGPLGTVVLSDGAAPVLISALLRDTDGNGGVDLMRFVFSEPVAMPLQLSGGADVVADTIVASIEVGPFMSGASMPVISSMEITGANVAAAGPGGGPGVMTLRKRGRGQRGTSTEPIRYWRRCDDPG